MDESKTNETWCYSFEGNEGMWISAEDLRKFANKAEAFLRNFQGLVKDVESKYQWVRTARKEIALNRRRRGQEQRALDETLNVKILGYDVSEVSSIVPRSLMPTFETLAGGSRVLHHLTVLNEMLWRYSRATALFTRFHTRFFTFPVVYYHTAGSSLPQEAMCWTSFDNPSRVFQVLATSGGTTKGCSAWIKGALCSLIIDEYDCEEVVERLARHIKTDPEWAKEAAATREMFGAVKAEWDACTSGVELHQDSRRGHTKLMVRSSLTEERTTELRGVSPVTTVRFLDSYGFTPEFNSEGMKHGLCLYEMTFAVIAPPVIG